MVIPISEYFRFMVVDKSKYYPQLVGVDLSLESVSLIDSGRSILGSIKKNGTEINSDYYYKIDSIDNLFILNPGVYSFVFEQGVHLNSNHYGEIVPRSSLVRCGGVIGSGIYEPGYYTDRIAAVIHLTNRVEIEKGARIVQIKIYKGTEFGVYDGQWKNGNDIK